MHMRTLFILIGLVLTSASSAQDTWTALTSPGGNGRHHPITVANDQYGYVIAGQAGFAALNLDDVHRYDPATDTWEEMTAFPGGGRGYGYGVCQGDDAFLGFGSNNSGFPTDWWHLDMANGVWTALADFPGMGRNHPAMVLAGGLVMVGLGSNDTGNLGDWWAYDIASGTWEPRAPFTAGNRHHPYYFGIDGQAYVGFGHGDTQNGSLTIYRDFHRYDPATDSWTALQDFPGEARVAGTQFAKDGKGYILSGDGDDHGPLDAGEMWRYDPALDGWTELAPHPGGARWAPGSFVMGCYVYLTGGLEGVTDTYHQDLWRYSLSAECGCTDPGALNFSAEAETDDGSCCFVSGCMQESAINFDPEACLSDGTCIAPILGCTDSTSPYFAPDANTETALGGPLSATALGSGGYHLNDNWDMVFSVSEPTVLEQVEVLAQTAFSIDVYIRNAEGQTLWEDNVGLAEGWNALDIGIELPNGTGFTIGIAGDNQGLFRNNAVPAGSFPIAVADRMSITGNTTDSPQDYFYYFYRWRVAAPCTEPTSLEAPSAGQFGVHPNPTRGQFTITGLKDGQPWTVVDLGGRAVASGQGQSQGQSVDLSSLPAGVFLFCVNAAPPVKVVLSH